MANNITEVRLLNVPLENDYLHTLYFASAAAQASYFISRQVGETKSNFSYQRKDNIIRYPAQYDSLLGCNYVMYKNEAYSNKWFYAFITDLKYVDDGRTDISIETDVIQTWLFDYIIKTSFVEREHVKDDSIGLHTVPEQLETGDYVINAKNKNSSLLLHSIMMAVTVDLNTDDFDNAAGGYYNGIYSGVKYYKMTAEEANRAIKALADAGKSDAIVSIFMCPAMFVSALYDPNRPKSYAAVETGQDVAKKDWVSIVGVEDEENYKPTNLNGYTPKNNKLFTYPYCYMLMTNNSGGTALYKYELFNNPENSNHCAFYIYASTTPGFSIYLSPRYYNGVDINSFEGLTLGKFPICSWNTDVYTNWLTQNAVNIPISIFSNVAQMGLGVAGAALSGATGGLSMLAGAGSLSSGAIGIANTVGEVYQHSLQPPQAEGNINSGDVMFSSGTLTFTAYQMTIKKEYAAIIDNYFSMKGYKVNSVKVPNKNHRANYWYTKTIDVNIDGAIPMNEMKKIKQCYNNGITFWKNPSNIQNYSVDNSII